MKYKLKTKTSIFGKYCQEICCQYVYLENKVKKQFLRQKENNVRNYKIYRVIVLEKEQR